MKDVKEVGSKEVRSKGRKDVGLYARKRAWGGGGVYAGLG
jgi:hypothetical protein